MPNADSSNPAIPETHLHDEDFTQLNDEETKKLSQRTLDAGKLSYNDEQYVDLEDDEQYNAYRESGFGDDLPWGHDKDIDY